MSAVKQIPREKIISAAMEEVREKGMEALNARSLAARLGCSTRPVYLSFGGMEEVRAAVADGITKVYRGYLGREVVSGKYPPYKAYGMAYIRFAREEREFFKFLFMRDRTRESDGGGDIGEIVSAVMKSTGLSEERARLFHLESWIFVHGIAAMLATSYINFDENMISDMLTDMFVGLKARFGSK